MICVCYWWRHKFADAVTKTALLARMALLFLWFVFYYIYKDINITAYAKFSLFMWISNFSVQTLFCSKGSVDVKLYRLWYKLFMHIDIGLAGMGDGLCCRWCHHPARL